MCMAKIIAIIIVIIHSHDKIRSKVSLVCLQYMQPGKREWMEHGIKSNRGHEFKLFPVPVLSSLSSSWPFELRDLQCLELESKIVVYINNKQVKESDSWKRAIPKNANQVDMENITKQLTDLIRTTGPTGRPATAQSTTTPASSWDNIVSVRTPPNNSIHHKTINPLLNLDVNFRKTRLFVVPGSIRRPHQPTDDDL